MGLSARAQKVQSCARLCGRDVHRNFFPIIPLSIGSVDIMRLSSDYVSLVLAVNKRATTYRYMYRRTDRYCT